MRYPLYLLTIASCLLLVGLFYNRGATVAAVIAGAAALFYIVRLVMAGRDSSAPEPVSDVEGQAPSAQRAEAITRLQTRRKAYNENRAKLTLVVIVVAVVGMAVWFSGNPAFASAISIANLPLLWLVWRNSKAIRMIDDGLRGRTPQTR